MDKISQEELDKATESYEGEVIEKTEELTESEFKKLLEIMQNPVQAQQQIAVKIKLALDKRIKEEMADKGYLSDHTRRWVETYNNILEKIQKALHGDKSVSLHVHAVTHSQIATKIRDAQKNKDEDTLP